MQKSKTFKYVNSVETDFELCQSLSLIIGHDDRAKPNLEVRTFQPINQ